MLLDATSPLLVAIPLMMAVSFVSGYASGAPENACSSMTPGHYGASAQTSAAPYGIQLSQSTYTAGASIDVTISGNGDQFKGFLLQARRSEGAADELHGSFTNLPSESRTVCADQAVTHSSSIEKGSITFTWIAPDPAVGQVVFRATVVRHRPVWWENVLSLALDEEITTTTTTIRPTTAAATGSTSSGTVSSSSSSSDNESSTPLDTGGDGKTQSPSDSSKSTADDAGRVTIGRAGKTTIGGMASYSTPKVQSDSGESTPYYNGSMTERPIDRTTTGGVASYGFNIALLAALGTLVLRITRCL